MNRTKNYAKHDKIIQYFPHFLSIFIKAWFTRTAKGDPFLEKEKGVFLMDAKKQKAFRVNLAKDIPLLGLTPIYMPPQQKRHLDFYGKREAAQISLSGIRLL
jgi:hypothetical protein